jgi:hypothetical protein
VGIFVGVLNDEEHEQDKDDPSSTHHDDRGVRGQIGGPCSMCHEGLGLRQARIGGKLVSLPAAFVEIGLRQKHRKRKMSTPRRGNKGINYI